MTKVTGKNMEKNLENHITELWNRLQEQRPLVHCITNIVTVNDCANILLAAGASPTMAHHELEVEEVTEGCRSLVCNMGAMECLGAMKLAGKRARQIGRPIVIDPVGAAGASFRRQATLDLIKEAKPSCIRGNYSEIKALLLEKALGAGVDVQERDAQERFESQLTAWEAQESFENQLTAWEAAKALAKKYDCFVVASGKVDYVSDGNRTFAVENGSEFMSRVTGMGCMSSAMTGAFLGVEASLEAVLASCVVMGLCGEIAERETLMAGGGSATFHIKFIDAVSMLTAEAHQCCSTDGQHWTTLKNKIRCYQL